MCGLATTEATDSHKLTKLWTRIRKNSGVSIISIWDSTTHLISLILFWIRLASSSWHTSATPKEPHKYLLGRVWCPTFIKKKWTCLSLWPLLPVPLISRCHHFNVSQSSGELFSLRLLNSVHTIFLGWIGGKIAQLWISAICTRISVLIWLVRLLMLTRKSITWTVSRSCWAIFLLEAHTKTSRCLPKMWFMMTSDNSTTVSSTTCQFIIELSLLEFPWADLTCLWLCSKEVVIG